MKPLLLCTDLDRTLIPNGSQPESEGARALFSQLMATDELQLVYVSGRDKGLIQQAIQDYELPIPDFAIADVGASIYHVDGEVWQRWHIWDEEISQDWQGYSGEALHGLLEEVSQLRLQEPEKQSRYKLSYYLSLKEDHQAVMRELEKRFQAKKIQANLIWSIDEAEEIGLLDILPASANKLHAIMFLIMQQGFTNDQAIFAGDSGNDLDVLLSPLQSILVANASPEVRVALQKEGADQQGLCYFAQGNFLAMNGHYSAGILEGIAHYRPDMTAVIEGLK